MILSLKFSLLTKGKKEEGAVSEAVVRDEEGAAQLGLEGSVPTREADTLSSVDLSPSQETWGWARQEAND